MPDVLDDPLLTPETIASALELREPDGRPNVAAVYEFTRSRARDPLPALRVGKYLRVRRSAFAAWVERRAWTREQLDRWLEQRRAERNEGAACRE